MGEEGKFIKISKKIEDKQNQLEMIEQRISRLEEDVEKYREKIVLVNRSINRVLSFQSTKDTAYKTMIEKCEHVKFVKTFNETMCDLVNGEKAKSVVADLEEVERTIASQIKNVEFELEELYNKRNVINQFISDLEYERCLIL